MPVWINFEPGEPCQWIVGGGRRRQRDFKKRKRKTDRITLHIFGFSSNTTIYRVLAFIEDKTPVFCPSFSAVDTRVDVNHPRLGIEQCIGSLKFC